MARGQIYYITQAKDDQVKRFGETMFYEDLDKYGMDYVRDESEEGSSETLTWLSKALEKMGAEITGREKGSHFAFSFSFPEVEKMQQAYFGPKLEKLKKEVSELDLFKVIRSAPCLDMILNSKYDDMVVFHDECSEYTLTYDDFIRQIKSGVTYYVFERIVIMH